MMFKLNWATSVIVALLFAETFPLDFDDRFDDRIVHRLVNISGFNQEFKGTGISVSYIPIQGHSSRGLLELRVLPNNDGRTELELNPSRLEDSFVGGFLHEMQFDRIEMDGNFMTEPVQRLLSKLDHKTLDWFEIRAESLDAKQLDVFLKQTKVSAKNWRIVASRIDGSLLEAIELENAQKLYIESSSEVRDTILIERNKLPNDQRFKVIMSTSNRN